MSKKFLMICAMLTMICFQDANAMYLFDTGGPTIQSGAVLYDGPYKWGARFTLDKKKRIEGLETYLVPTDWTFQELTIQPGVVNFGIYGEGLSDHYVYFEQPDLDNKYFSAEYIHPENTHEGGWYGVDGLDYILEPGSYWIVLQTPEGSTFRGLIGIFPPNPLERYVGYRVVDREPFLDTFYRSQFTYSYRIKGGDLVEGQAPVPEPATMLLFAGGLGGVFLNRKRFAKKSS